MKGIQISVALVLLLVSPVSALAACGIGSKLWQGRSGVAAKVVASITNLFTFKGISTTFGLAGCTDADNIFTDSRDAKVRHFASQKFDRLAEDMARGQGEHLDALSHLLQIHEGDRQDFQAFAQRNFAALFAHDQVTVGEWLETLARLMAEDEKLRGYVPG